MSQTNNVVECVKSLEEGALTPVQLAEQSLKAAKEHKHLNAFVSVDADIVFSQAKAAHERRQAGEALSPIDGVPIAVKDNYLTKEYPTTACSNAKPLEPANEDATIIANLRKAGAVIFGKTNMHEWAYGATNSTSNIGATHNPHNVDHITGGSSGGSAAAVAAGIVPAALGSDTGGSVRIPASACGIYGFKPSYGRASRHGVLPLSWSLDVPGPMAGTLEDLALLLPHFFGPDSRDAATHHAKKFNPIPKVGRAKGLNLLGDGLERCDDVDAALNVALAQSNVDVQSVELAHAPHYFAAWEAILHCEASAYHGELLAQDPSGFSEVTRAHLEAGKRIKAVELLKAQQMRAKLITHLLKDLEDWDVLILPTLPVPAPKHGQDWQEFGGRKVTTQDSMTWFCWIGSLSGLPCVTLPIGKSAQGLPIGMMLMGRPGQDEALLAHALQIEEQLNG